MKKDPFDNPERNAATLRNLNYNFQIIGFRGWLETVTFDQVVDAWWAAQERRAAKADRCQPLTLQSKPRVVSR